MSSQKVNGNLPKNNTGEMMNLLKIHRRTSLLIKRFALFFCLLVVSLNLFGQVIGDYGTTGAGPNRWDQTTSWCVCTTAGTWTGATAAGSIPSASTNVWIRAGHTIQVRTSAGANVCNNMTVVGSVVYRNNNTYTLTVNGNIIGTGSIDMSAGTGTSTLNIGGDLSCTGAFTCSNGTVNFNGDAGSQSILSATYYNINFTGSSIKTLSGNIIVNRNCIVTSNLYCNNYIVNDGGTTTFTLQNAGTLGIGNANGISTAGATGNIRLDTRTFNTGANYTYNGTAAQVTGNGLPATVNNLTINNSTGVTLSGSVTTTGTLDLQQGALSLNGNTLTINGDIARTGAGVGTITGSATSSLNIYGNGALSNVYFTNATENLLNFTLNRVGSNIGLNSNLTLAGTLALTNGIISATGKTISLTSSAAASLTAGVGSYIDGTVSRAMTNAGGTYIFPVGSTCGSHWLTFSSISGTSTTKVTFACTGATTGDATIASPLPINVNWHVEKTSGTFTNATVKLDGGEIDFTNTVAKSALQAGTYTKVTSTPATGSVTAASLGAIATDTWLAIGSSKIKTYYSYQPGSWTTPSFTWTLDPSGTTQVGSSIPGNDDNVVILPGRTVTLPSDIATTGLNITIEPGGFLDLSTYQFSAATGLASLDGQGTLKISGSYFPKVTTNNFITATGGTTEFYNSTSYNLPTSQATYNNLAINKSGAIATQTIDLTLNGNLQVKNGTFQINDDTARRLKLTVNGDVTVNSGASLTVGTGVTNSTTSPTGITGSTSPAPFIDYYDLQSHRVVLKGNFTNNGTVRFTNLAYPVYDKFPPTTNGTTTGFATAYFQGASDNSLLCAGPTDFYNLVLDKGTDQTFKLTLYTSGSYHYFRLFGANISAGDGGTANPNLKKALWIRTGTLEVQGTTVIPSLTEGTTAAGSPNSDFIIPANGALVVNGIDVIIQTTADDYREVNVAYGTSAPDNASMGISTSGSGSSLTLYGKLEMDEGFLTTKESGGIITNSTSSGQFILNKGTVDTKQFLSLTGAASFEQNGGLFLLRGRFQRTPSAYTAVSNLQNAPLNTARINDASLTATAGTFNLNNVNNIFIMAGGTMRIYDVCGTTAPTYAFQVNSSTANTNVTGGTIEFVPTNGTSGSADAANHLIATTVSLSNVTINRGAGCSSVVQLNNALNILNNLTLTSGDFNANNYDLTIGGNILLASGTSYTPGTNTTTLNGSGTQTFTVNLASALSLNKFTIDKASGVAVNFAGSQKTINVADNFRLSLGTLNDNGNTINLAKDVYNSGVHTGSGKIVLNGTVAQAIDGNGMFQNIDLNNTTVTNAAPVSLAANTTINGALTLVSDKIFNIASYNLNITSTGSIAATAYSNTCYIHTSGQSGDGGITKTYTSNATFTFPVGCFSTNRTATYAYTPAAIGFNASPTTYGSITVIPVGYEHPATTVNNQSLMFYWKVKSSGFTGYTGKVTHNFVYNQTDATTTEANYMPSLYNRTAYSWNNGTVANPPINTTTNTITDWTTTANSTNFIDADYTAGDAAFGAVRVYYSLASGLWRANSTWTFNSNHMGAQAGSVPSANDIVVIGNNHTVTLTNAGDGANQYALNFKPVKCASLQIDAGATLDIENNSSSVFSTVVNNPLGNGTFRLMTTPAASGTNHDVTTYIFPGGDFTDFEINKGTEEFYTTTNDGNALYVLPPKGLFGTLKLSPLGGDNMAFPNYSAVTVSGDLTCNGTTAYSFIGISWNTNNTFYGFTPALYPTVEKTLTIKGNLNINGGSLVYWDDVVPQHLVVLGDVNIGSNNGACFIVYDASYSATPYNSGPTVVNTLVIGGNLNNNGTTNGKFSGTNFVTTNATIHYCDVTFNGSTNTAITGTGANNFHNVTINKGSSQATTLTCNTTGTLSTPVDAWLTLQNGTFIYDRSGKNLTITTVSPFTIPLTAGLNITNASDVYLANATSDVNDVYLNGKLTLVNGNVYVGPTNGTTNNNNDIEYSGSGASEIDIQGGSLIVNGQIRRNPAVTNGVLAYKQSGGVVTINGNKANTTNAKLEVLNDGSAFNMSNGTLNIIRGGGGSTFGDLYLRPATSSVTGGTIVFSNVVPNTAQTYLLDANVPLNAITVTGAAGAGINATVKLMVNPLVLNGDLMLTNARSIFDANSTYNINLYVKGDFTNNGIYYHYNNLTTFNGGVQTLSGSTATDFYDLNVSPVTSLTLSQSTTVLHDITLGDGTLICGTNYVYVKNNVINNATYTNTNTTSGFVLNGAVQQHISGTGTFGQLELNNTNGSTIDNAITLNQNLVLTTGIFDINRYLLSLGVNSNLVANGTPFGLSKMITSDGVWSAVGISKVFTSPLSTTFNYPLGTTGKYTPAVLTINSNGAVGSIRINNINNHHPAVLDANNVLQYYWEVESTGISGFNGNLLLNYKDVDVKGGPESNYVAAQLLTPGTNWSKAATGSGTDRVDEANNTITFNFIGSSNITGECTAGNDVAIPSIVPQYTSNADGVWSDKTIWTPSGGSTYPCPDGGPNGFIVTINHVVTLDKSYCEAYKTYINNELRAILPYYGHSLGTVYGNGILYIESTVFPAGRFTSFLDCSGNGCLEYGGNGTYDVNADLYSSVPRLTFSGFGTRILPDKDLTICKQLQINGPKLDNSVNNRQLNIQGTMLLTAGSFSSGTGDGATVSFVGSSAQTIQDFNGLNAFNNLEINNSAGLTLTGQIDVAGKLLLTSGLITTTSSNILKITNFSVSCVTPTGGSSTSYIDGPLMKKINQGDPVFIYPIGKLSYGLGDKFALRATQSGTQYWTAEMFNPNDKTTFQSPLTAVNTKEYWTVSGVDNGSATYVEVGWKPSSDITPLMTQNGISDMRVAEHNGTDWIEIGSTATGGSNNSNGSVETIDKTSLATGTRNYTLACINVVKPRIRLTPSGPVCGDAGIPVTLTTTQTTTTPYVITYTENGNPKTLTPAPTSFPTTIPTLSGGGTYKLTGFTYSGGLVGVFDSDPVVVNPVPTTANAGPDQSLCGASSATLAGNNPTVGTGVWTIISGTGGTVTTPTVYNSDFTGTNGMGYTLRWTIKSGTGTGACTSYDDVNIDFPLMAIKPSPFTVATTPVCRLTNGVTYTVPNDPTASSYNWSYSGTGVIINTIIGTPNSVTLDFGAVATSGTLSVSVTNGCSTSSAQTIDITVNTLPAFSFTASPNQMCDGESTTLSTTFTSISTPYTIDIKLEGSSVTTPIPSGKTDNPYQYTPTISWSGSTPDKAYNYTVTVTDNNGCTTTSSTPLKVTIWKKPETGDQYHISNSFGY